MAALSGRNQKVGSVDAVASESSLGRRVVVHVRHRACRYAGRGGFDRRPGRAALEAPAGGFTVGDVLSRGGRQLSAAELQAFIPGTQWYTSIVGKPFVITILPDGTWRGEAAGVRNSRGAGASMKMAATAAC